MEGQRLRWKLFDEGEKAYAVEKAVAEISAADEAVAVFAVAEKVVAAEKAWQRYASRLWQHQYPWKHNTGNMPGMDSDIGKS